MKLPPPTLTLLLLLSGCAAVMADDFSDFFQRNPDMGPQPGPTETVDYSWKHHRELIENNSQLFRFQATTETVSDKSGFVYYRKYLKVPYKIEWHCSDWDMVTLSDRLSGTPSCVRQEGYREDGAVVWRKVKP